MRLRLFSFILLTFLLIECGVPVAPYRSVKLPSGKEVKVLAEMKMFFSKGDPALMLKYETDLSVSDVPALRKEVQEIWDGFFQSEVDKAKLNFAIISALEVPKGTFIKQSAGYNFVFEKSPDGKWATTK